MSNTATLEKFASRRAEVQAEVEQYSLVPMNLNEIHKSGNRFYNAKSELTTNSLNSLLGILGIKDKLVDEIENDEKQWVPLHSALTNIRSNRIVTAVRNNHRNEIVDIYKNPIKDEKPVDLTNGLRYTEEFLRTTESNLELKNFYFNPTNLSIGIEFNNPDTNVDVFGDGKDFWKTGFGITFSPNKTQTYPFFLRLICSNGMMGVHRMSQRFVDSDSLTQKTFVHQIQRYLTADDRDGAVRASCDRLRNNNASVREFYNAKAIIEKLDKDMAARMFDDQEIIKAYGSEGIDINKQSNRWLASANSNINSYDFFNDLTHTVSHKLTDAEIATRMELNRLASGLFFDGPDLARVAPDPFKKREVASYTTDR